MVVNNNPEPNTVVPAELKGELIEAAPNGRMIIDLTKSVVTSYIFKRNAIQGEDLVPLDFWLKDGKLPHPVQDGDTFELDAMDKQNKIKMAMGIADPDGAGTGYVNFRIPQEFYQAVGPLNMILTINQDNGNQKSIYLRQNVYPNQFDSLTINSEDYLDPVHQALTEIQAVIDNWVKNTNTAKNNVDSTMLAIQAELDAAKKLADAGMYVTPDQLATAIAGVKVADATDSASGLLTAALHKLLTATDMTAKHYEQRQVIWSGIAKDINTIITFSTPVTDFNYIEVVFNDNSGGVVTERFSPDKKSISGRVVNITDDDLYFTVYEITLAQIDATHYKLALNHRVDTYIGSPAKTLINTADLLSVNEISGVI